ncbi:MAG: pitrilysin family protein [Proteobacteria bacterium]|nr:pitrilysin family protein [Pseudomonadota bacterium]
MMKFVRTVLLLFQFALATAAFAAPVAVPPGVAYVTTVEGISEYRLDNGLKVLLFPDASKPTMTLNITYLVGSRHENYGETGMAHLLEHLVFKGTPAHASIPQEFKERGARFNGTTWLDRTNYFEMLPASDDNLKWAIGLEADRMVNSFIARKDLDSEMTVVRNEFEMGENNPGSVLLKRMQSMAFDWHSYGRSTIGNRSDIENVRIENLQAFYRAYYQPDNAVLTVAGKFDPAAALGYIVAAFGKIAKPQRTLPPFWTVEPTQDGERSFMVRRKDDTQMVWVAYKVPSRLNGDSVAIVLGGKILGDTPTGRLHKSLVETGKAAAVFAFEISGYAPGLQIFGAQVKKGEAMEPVRDALLAQIEASSNTPPTQQELERVKNNRLKYVEKTLNDHEAIGVALSETIALGDWRLYFKWRDDLDKITIDQIAAAAGKYYRRDNRTVGIYQPEDAPQRAEIAPAPPLAEVMKSFRAKAETSSGEVFDATPANIDARTSFVRVGGLKVALLPKKNRGETVAVNVRLNWGNERTLFGKQAVSRMTYAMLGRGTAKMTREQISDAQDKLKMTGGLMGFQTTRQNLEGALRLAAHVARDASFPENEFEQLKKQILTGLTSQLNQPNARAGEAINRHFNQYPRRDWRYQPTLEEQIEDYQNLTLAEVKQFHRDFFGASSGQVAIVGDFDPAQAKAVLEEELASWRSHMPYTHVLWQYADIPAAKLDFATPDKENAMLLARVNVNIKDDAPDYPSLMVANHILGGGALSSRLADRLRQKDGVSYGVGSGLKVSPLDNAGSWSAYAIAAPQNLTKAEKGIREELARALKDGVTAAEVSAAIDSLIQARAQSRAQDERLAAQWNELMFVDRRYSDWEEKLDAAIKSVTAESANAALKKYVDADKLTVAIAADPAKRQ